MKQLEFPVKGLRELVEGSTARFEIQSSDQTDLLVQLFRDRVTRIEPGSIDEVRLTLNAWNLTHDLGVQSVSVGIYRDGKEILMPYDGNGHREWKSPTVGMIHRNLIAGDEREKFWALTEFSLDQGTAERVRNLSPVHPGLHLCSNALAWDDPSSYLQHGQSALIEYPNAVRTVIERRNPLAKDVVGVKPNPGAYYCEFLKREA